MLLTRSVATMMAISREITYAKLPLALPVKLRRTSPTLGRTLVVAAELVLVLILCFYRLDPKDKWQWEDVGYRTGAVALAQVPLVFLLAGKINIIGLLIGSGYERLSWLHRWTARILFLTVTIHMGFWFRNWDRYDFILRKMKKDEITQKGFAAWCILLWIVLSSWAPIRRWNYEVFVVQHVVTFAGFTAAVYLHIPKGEKRWVWIPIGFAIADRVGRYLMVLYTNLSLFHPRSNRGGLWACQATLEPLGSDMTRVSIHNPPVKWSPGQHVFLACHSIAPLQSHPFTIASLPQDGKMRFLIKSKTGGTKRFFGHAEKHQGLPLAKDDVGQGHGVAVAIEGPYGRIRPLRQFDSVVLIAGSSGCSFVMPLMRDLVASWKKSGQKQSRISVFGRPVGAVTRYVRFVWVVKSRRHFEWFAAELTEVSRDMEWLHREEHDVRLDMSLYITCDEVLEVQRKVSSPSPIARVYAEPLERPVSAISTDEGLKRKGDHSSIKLIHKSSGSQQDIKVSCGPDDTCCCTNTVEDELQISSFSCGCHCHDEKTGSPKMERTGSFHSSGMSSILAGSEKFTGPLIHPIITTFSGRPRPENLIRKTLEQALGESAVVVCGPQGLVDDVRQSVVALSDERAVHKGTGAQGIYLHTEAFDY